MKRITKLIIGCGLSFCLFATITSCKKSVLDRPMDIEVKDTLVFGYINYATDFVTDIYAGLPNGYTDFSSTLNEAATDDAKHGNPSHVANRFTNDSWGINNNPDDKYASYYSGIRKCNMFLSKIDLVKLKDHGTDVKINGYTATEQKDRLIGEVVFLRAYFYAELLKRYGGVPLVTKVLNPDDDLDLPRNTYDEVLKQVVEDCDLAVTKLPSSYLVPGPRSISVTNYYGRATKWAAQALKSRTLLYAASPINNPGNNAVKWIAAYEAAKPFYETSAVPMVLNPGIAGYEALFRGNTTNLTEIIWSRPSTNNNLVEALNYPIGIDGSSAGINPSQSLVDAYEMKPTGKPISDPTSGYNAGDPYLNRDPRLTATIFYNGATFKSPRRIETFDGGLDGPQKVNGSLTGYYMKKHLDVNLNLTLAQSSQHNFIYFRLAEMLLNYAEARNEAEGPVAEVYTVINRIRTRATMPNLPVGLSKEQMRLRIQNERRVELAFEGHRYWDARRWNIAKEVFNGPFYGMKIVKTGTTTFSYTPYQIEERVFKENMNLYPIQQREILANPNLVQNQGWTK
ncbi:Starch-binding associating with outer membrane [Pedobacter steynii]|uniref:Starch-binding associating with outer membrane n=1 Tax=Pedobacter steynii TaxID=430522 RepID=A0A1G9NI79_9SPHI|nr:RagB/SusD family nutrient uptake outer membrane protein [Pedobacter steynii]NQX39295.1 RagB/SusD family nutrient uptake outer membrane protein [Pedobacter steynii]SDL86091.1 Starch-binding associating with outer membrane [Pedobacter steynii]